MTIKEMERNALEQIKKIVADLGADSYVGTALEGCFEIAEQNIDNDWACSMKQRVETAEASCDLRRDQVHELEKHNKELQATVDLRNMEIESKEKDIKCLSERCTEYKERERKECCARVEAERKVEKLESEIIKLKAKLYDLMTA